MIKKIKNSFVNEPVNLGRQSELDVAKGIAIIFMVFCHSFEILCDFFKHYRLFLRHLSEK